MNPNSSAISINQFLKPYLAKRKFLLFVFSITCVLATLESGLDAYFLKLVIDTVTQVQPADLLMAVFWPAIFYVGMSLYHNLIMRAYHWGMMVFYPELKQNIMQDLFAYTAKHSVSFFQTNLSGDIAAKIQDITESIEPLLRNIFEIFIARATQPLIVAIFLSIVGWSFSVIYLIWAGLFIYCTLKLSKLVGQNSHQYSQEKNILSGRLIDILGNIITTKIFGRLQFESLNLNTTLETVKNSEKKLHWSLLNLHFIQGLLSFVILVCFVGLLIHERINNQVSVGDFVFVLSLLVVNLSHIYALGEGIGDSTKTIAKFRQAINILLGPHDVGNKPNAQSLNVSRGTISFKEVDFQYIDDKPIFSNFNLSIQANETIGIVGASGAGKSTLVNLLLRLVEPQKGSIQIDGTDISDVTLNSLRNQITLVPQQIDLFHRSIMDNIRYGNLEADEQQIIQAAKLAECDDFIQLLPDGYNTLVGERGMKLSGGQKQRLAIARAYLKPAKILILDEATASLDAITEAYIQRALTDIMQNKTTLIIAHRLATLKQVDRIIVFDNGKIVQDGKLDDLINQAGLFLELWKNQHFSKA
tara:strand:- start:23059 stop:24816 length:1758 start_codon:yes stop_codon:yes gene_type:complete